ncbi:MAG: PAS domain S-box protein, partial [Bacteroidota bacterium]
TLKLSDLVVPEKLFRTIRSLHLLKKKGKFTFATEVKRKSGRTIDVEVSASSLGKNTYVAICTDISHRVKAERDARSLENEYQSFVSSLPYPYAIFVNRKLALKNTAFDSLFPWIKEAGPSVSDFFGRRNPELLKEISMMLDEPTSTIVIQNREVLVPAPLRGRRPERQTVATEVSISRIQYEGKQSLYCTFVDVAERRRIIDRAEETEEKFKTLLEKSLDAISISQDEKFIRLNSSFVEMFGYSSAMELLGKEITSVISGRNARAEILEIEKNRVQGKEAPSRYEYTGVKKDGSKISVEVQSARIKLDGKWAILAYHRDVTMQKNAEENVARKTKGLEVLNRISDEVSGATSLEDIYHHGMNAAIRGTQFEVGAVFAVDRIHSTMNIRQHRSLSENILAKLGTQSLDDGFAHFFNKAHEPIVASIADYPPYLHYKSLFEAEQYKTVAFLPLVVKGVLYGVLMLATTKEKSLD